MKTSKARRDGGGRTEPEIAIVGMAHRFPGPHADGLWPALLAGEDLVSTVQASRWAQQVFLHPRRSEPGTAYTFAAGSIGDVSGFDADFFGISPREAGQMDPQQRVLLELAWESFERAGIVPSSVRGSRCGVFVGISSLDYGYRRADDLSTVDATTMSGNAASIAANRLSYFFDLRGPSMALDTACSSSLVALHQACVSIRGGESSMAVVGGISLHLHPLGFVGFSKASMLSPRGRCNVFDAAGDGYVRSEGGAVVLLKLLDEALADGNRVLAVIAGSGVNCDGRTHGLTVPSAQAQAQLLREVYARAGIKAEAIDYVEIHGTGTSVGDPIETRALGEALGLARSGDRPLPIGSVKSNLGHLEAAAGMAGLVKALLSIEHRCVPATIGVSNLNPAIRFSEWNLEAVTTNMPLSAVGAPVIGINSFGFGGSNAHVVLKGFQPPVRHGDARAARPSAAAVDPPALILSGRSEQALRSAAREMAQHLRIRTEQSWADIACSAAYHRETHDHRLIAVGGDRGHLVEALDRFAANGDSPLLVSATIQRHAPAPVFVYSGNGAQWVGMGQQLLAQDPVFRQAVEETDALYCARGGRSIVAALQAAAGNFDLTEVAQPALFAIQVGVTRMLHHWGVREAAVVGHSVGEVAAAWACGALGLDQAVQVIHERSRFQGRTKGLGQMTALAASETEARALLEQCQLSGRIAVAAVNASHSVTLSGDVAALAQFEQAASAAALTCKRLELDYAFHSRHMDGVAEGLQRALATLRPRNGRIAFWSTVTGAPLPGGKLDAGYWWRNVREPVQFHQAISALIRGGMTSFVEIGPQAILRGYLRASLNEAKAQGLVLASLLRGNADRRQVERTAHTLLASGAPMTLEGVAPAGGEFVDLPCYPWQRETHWHPASGEPGGLVHRRWVHPLLGYRPRLDIDLWENHLDTASHPLYADHVVAEAVVFPAAGFVDMALAAARAWRADIEIDIEGLEIRAPLLLEHDRSKTVQTIVSGPDGRFIIRSRERSSDGPWISNVVGRFVERSSALLDDGPSEASADFATEATAVSARQHYDWSEALGLAYGPGFRSVAGARVAGRSVFAELTMPPSAAAESEAALLHPSLLDGGFQLLVNLLPSEVACGTAGAFVPVRIEHLQLLQPGRCVRTARTDLVDLSARSALANLSLFDADGKPVALLRGVRLRALRNRKTAPREPATILERAARVPRADDGTDAVLPSLADFREWCATRMHEPVRQRSRHRLLSEVEPLLDVLCAAYAQRALHRFADSDGLMDPVQMVAEGRVAAGMEPLLRRLLGMLEEDGLARRVDRHWRWCLQDALPAPEDIWNRLMGNYPEHSRLIAMVGHAGMRLDRNLAGGDAAPAGPARAARLEAESKEAPAWSAHADVSRDRADIDGVLAAVIGQAAARQPAGRRLRVLMFHASPPSSAASVLPAVDAATCEFVVAARSAALLGELELLMRRPTVVRTGVVDLEQPVDAAALGGRFDIIAMPGGLAEFEHADAVLRNVRELLRPDSTLLVVEQYPTRAYDLAFGSDPRWWRDAGGSVPRSRLRTPAAWLDMLEREGFSCAEPVFDVPDHSGVNVGLYVLMARSERRAALESRSAPSMATWLILQDETGYSAALGLELAKHLRAAGQRTIRVAAGQQVSFDRADAQAQLDPERADHWAEILKHSRGAAGTGLRWVHLQGLGPPPDATEVSTRYQRQMARTLSLMAWLQGGCSDGAGPDSWVVTAGASVALVPAALRSGLRGRGDMADDAALWGFARVAINEYPNTRIRCVDLADAGSAADDAALLTTELLYPDAEDEVIVTNGGRFAPRVQVEAARDAAPVAGAAGRDRPHVQLTYSAPGSLKNLMWSRRAPAAPGPGEVEIAVRAAGLNFRDVMSTMGLLPDEALQGGFAGNTLGMELSGVVTAIGEGVTGLAVGEAVIAFAPSSLGTQVITPATAVQLKPSGWAFEAAATAPAAFFTAYYALVELARLQLGERVLIHGAAGGVGLAALQLAKSIGAEVFATAGTAEKRDVVRLLGADHVLDSRSLAYADEIMALTHGEGVDIVLNSLAGEAIRRNLRILKPFGRFLELGKRDFYEDTPVGLRPMRNNISYFGIDADQLLAHRPELAQRVFEQLMRKFSKGDLKPLPHRVFDAIDAPSAFRCMLQSRHIGKVIVSFPPDFAPDIDDRVAPAPLVLDAGGCYLVTGGASGFGLRTASWLARKGAKHLILLNRLGAVSDEARIALGAFGRDGVSAEVIGCDVTDHGAVEAMLAQVARSHPPLRGVVHAAAVIDDGLIRDMTPERLNAVLAPKVLGALHLDQLTRGLALDFFVLFSSATALFGNPGQGNYVAANMALQGLAQSRRAKGLVATCIAWGPIGDAGYLTRHERVKNALLARMGGRALDADVALGRLERMLVAGTSQSGILDMDWATLARHLPSALAPKFSELECNGAADAAADPDADDLRHQLQALDPAKRELALSAVLREVIGAILCVEPDKLDSERSVADMGMDSMMGVELATALEARLGISLPLMALGEGTTIAGLARRIGQQIEPQATADETSGAQPLVTQQALHIARQHASEIDVGVIESLSASLAETPRAALPMVPPSRSMPRLVAKQDG